MKQREDVKELKLSNMEESKANKRMYGSNEIQEAANLKQAAD